MDDASYKNVVLSLQESYGKHIAPFHFPMRENQEFVGYVNVIQQKGKRWQADGTVAKCDVPDYSMENLEIYREALMEAVAETSEEFLDRYFGGDTFSENEIRQALRYNVVEGTIIPVMMGSNTLGRGMYTLLSDIVKYLPAPDQRTCTGINAISNDVFHADYNFSKPKSAYVFKTIVDPFIGKYSLIKVNSGVLKTDDTLYNHHKGDEFPRRQALCDERSEDRGGTGAARRRYRRSGQDPEAADHRQPFHEGKSDPLYPRFHTGALLLYALSGHRREG